MNIGQRKKESKKLAYKNKYEWGPKFGELPHDCQV